MKFALRSLLAAIPILGLVIVTGCFNKSSTVEAPPFTLVNLNGESMSLSDFRNQPLAINFWQMNCPSCVAELPYLNTAYRANNVPIITIVMGASVEAVKTFMADNGYAFPVLIDGSATVGASYGVRYTPTTFFVDREGLISSTKVGQFTSVSELEKALNGIG